MVINVSFNIKLHYPEQGVRSVCHNKAMENRIGLMILIFRLERGMVSHEQHVQRRVLEALWRRHPWSAMNSMGRDECLKRSGGAIHGQP
jgi:hypothetical protein